MNKIYDVNNFITFNKLDILYLNETFLNEKITNINSLSNYHLIRNDRLSRGGGDATIIRKGERTNTRSSIILRYRDQRSNTMR